LIVNTPGAHVVLENSVIVTGTTTVADVNANSFVSSATHSGGITVTDSNNTRLVLSGSASNTTVTISSPGNVVLDGVYSNIEVNGAANITLNGEVTGTLEVTNADSQVSLGDEAVIAPENFTAPVGYKKEVNGNSVLTSPSLHIWAESPDYDYELGTVRQFNVNFEGKTLGDFNAAEVLLYVGDQLVGTNSVKASALETYATSVGLTGVLGNGPYEEDTTSDGFWNYSAYTSSVLPDKVVIKITEGDLVYVVNAVFSE
jgi:hypothetical protein